jgi:hypothetical protein
MTSIDSERLRRESVVVVGLSASSFRHPAFLEQLEAGSGSFRTAVQDIARAGAKRAPGLPGAFLGNRFPLTASVFTFRFGGDRFVLIRSQ